MTAKVKGGYILQPRIFDSSEASKMPPVTRELWFYLLRNVNYSDNGDIKRGQGFFNLSDIQDHLSWHVGYRKMKYSKPQLTKSLRRLREESMIETTKEIRGVVVTICNFNYFQDPENYERNNEGPAKATRRKSSGITILEEEVQEGRKKENKDIQNKTCCIEFKPADIDIDLWVALIENRKFKKLQNSKIALTAIINSFRAGVAAGYSMEDCITQYVSCGWQRFNPEWMKNKNMTQSGNISPREKRLHDINMLNEMIKKTEARERNEPIAIK